jgi:conjugal transfer ATP-binding protein TraC
LYHSRCIVNNSALKLLLKQSPSSIDLIGDVFALTTGEKQILVNCNVGEGIFFAGPRHVAIQILAFPTEHTIITTNPKELMRQKSDAEAK